ncbi:MAG: hypothetical protein ACE15B_08190 [Bryobacteraceae bacterium]
MIADNRGTRLPRWVLAGAVSALALAPCWWQSRIQAGDLSSHVYNAWLAELIARGEVEGLHLVFQPTNVLFDLLLGCLFRILGAGAAQRIAVSAAVLVFLWGAFALFRAVARRSPWFLLPVLLMLAYGWVFHMGFFNFYMSLGLSFAAMALAWRGRWPASVPVFILAYTAHGLPVAWALCVLGYRWMAQRVRPRYRLILFGAALAAVTVFAFALRARYLCRWSGTQWWSALAIDQVWVYGGEYFFFGAGLLLVFALYGARLKVLRVALGIPLQCAALTAAGIVLLPAKINLPGYAASLGFISERMSLALAVALCAALAAARPRRWQVAMAGALAAVFFARMYADERGINAYEDRLEAAVAALAPGSRVINTVWNAPYRTVALYHAIDRACIGRCFSYANYEPSSRQFRIRVNGPNGVVMARYSDSASLESGQFLAREEDLPLYGVTLCGSDLCVKPLQAGSHAEINLVR